MFGSRDSRGSVEVAFTDRHGGVSVGAFSSLNLAEVGDDDPAAIRENLRRVAESFTGTPGRGAAARVVRMHQVHGAEVGLVDATEERDLLAGTDGMVTATPGVVLMVRAADCVPVLLADPVAGVVGVAHAGRKGLVEGVVPATVDRMREVGAGDVVAWLGPRICGRCYEVPAEMRESAVRVVPEAHSETSWGTPALDVGAGILAQLREAKVDDVVDAGRCTLEDPDLYSYRRDGDAAGRFAGLVWVRP